MALHPQRHASRYSHYKRHQEFCERLCLAFQLTSACSKSECNTAINRGVRLKACRNFANFVDLASITLREKQRNAVGIVTVSTTVCNRMDYDEKRKSRERKKKDDDDDETSTINA